MLRVTGLQVDAGSRPLPATRRAKWGLIVGDSITEGSGATELAPYSHLVGQALWTLGYEYGLSACGWSGWLNRGDNPPGDVPGYYVVSGSANGAGGRYDDAASRWNKLDGNNHSLLDAAGHRLSEGAVAMTELKAGQYFLLVSNRADAATLEVQPVLVGVAKPGREPPEAVKRHYWRLVTGDGDEADDYTGSNNEANDEH